MILKDHQGGGGGAFIMEIERCEHIKTDGTQCGSPALRARGFYERPAGVLALHVEDVILHLKGKLVGIPKGTSAPIGQSLYPAFLVAIEDLVAGFAGDSELPAQFRHWLAG